MRPDSGGRDFVEEAGGHLIVWPLPPLPELTVFLLLLPAVEFSFAALWEPELSTFLGVISDAILPGSVSRPDEDDE